MAASGAAAAAAASDEGEPTVRNGGVAECGRALGRLRRALARRGLRGQTGGDARPFPTPRGVRSLKPVGHRNDSVRQLSPEVEPDSEFTRRIIC